MARDPAHPLRAATHFTALVAGAVVVGTLTGAASWLLFEALDRATELRIDNGWLVWTLPLVALSLGLLYHVAEGESRSGTSLVIARSLPPADDSGTTSGCERVRVPARLAPLVFGATFAAQLTGASVGREGAAIQIGGSLTSVLTRPLRLQARDERLLLVAAMAGAFGGAFGVPVAGAVFGLEVQQTGRLRYEGLAPALAASITADRVVEALGRATPVVDIPVDLDASLILRLAVVGLMAGGAARLFIALTSVIRLALQRHVTWYPARPVVGAVATLLLMLLVGRDYLGLSLPLIDGALDGTLSDWWDPALKILFTAVALGSGIPGGEVTPLFVVGATLGSVLSAPLGLPAMIGATACFAAVFGAAANTPIACTVLAVELFGAAMAVPAAVVCIIAFAVSPERGIYEGQSPGSRKDLRATEGRPPRS